MPFFWISALKDVRRRLSDPLALLTWLGIPLVIGGLMSLVMGGDGGLTPRAKLWVVDLDDSFISHFLVNAAGQGGEESMLEAVSVELEEGRRRMDAGDGSALLVIPEGFGKALLEETPTEWRLVTNPAQRILPGIIEEGLEIAVDAAFYAQRLFGEQLRLLAEGPADDLKFFRSATIATTAASINERLQVLESTLFPPLLELEFEVDERDPAPSQGMGQLLFPGMLFLAMLFIAQGMSADLWEEKTAGTLRRLFSSPQGVGSFLLGKLLAAGCMIASVTLIGLALGAALFEFPLLGLLPALLWGTFSGITLVSLFLFVQSLGANQQAASVLTSILLFPLMMMGGSLFPMEALPAWIIDAARWTPNGLGLMQFKSLLRGAADVSQLVQNALYLGGLALVFFLLAARRITGRMLSTSR